MIDSEIENHKKIKLNIESFGNISVDTENYRETDLDTQKYGELTWVSKTMARLSLTSKTPGPRESKAGAMLSVPSAFRSLSLVKHENIFKKLSCSDFYLKFKNHSVFKKK